jgi:hypothetical protein
MEFLVYGRVFKEGKQRRLSAIGLGLKPPDVCLLSLASACLLDIEPERME